MAEEMQSHLELQAAQYRAEGMSESEARRAAQKEFGNLGRIQEEARDARRVRWLEDLGRDVGFTCRQLRRQPGFTIAAVLTLALGIGFVTTLFTIVNGIAFRGLPFPDANRIVSIGVPSDEFAEIARQQTTCSDLSLVRSAFVNLAADLGSTRQPAAFVSANFLELLRVRPALGRGFLPTDARPGAPKVALIGDTLWRQDFGGERSAIDREIKINGEVHTIVGVMSPKFGFPRNESVWVPIAEGTRTAGALVVGRLAPSATIRSAAAEFSQIDARLASISSRAGSAGADRTGVEVIPFAERSIKGVVRNLLTGILGATFLVLLLACANVANLILARASERARELALRSALGASRSRLIVQMMTESLVLSLLGATLGVTGAYWGTEFVWSYATREAALTGGVPFWVNFKMDGAVLGFVAGVAVLTSVLTGLIPALRSSRMDVNQQLKDGSGTGRVSRLTRALVNVQMAVSVCLVVAAGLFLTLLIAFNQKVLPYDPSTVLTARMSVNELDYPNAVQQSALFDGLLLRFAENPSVAAAAITSAESFRASNRQIEIEGETYSRPALRPVVLAESVSPTFFETLQLDLRDGRVLRASDHATAPAVAVVNPAFAAKFSTRESVVGRRFRVATNDASGAWITVAGVVRDAGSLKAAQQTDGPRFYRPLAQESASTVTLVVRGRSDAQALIDLVRRTVAARDPNIPLNQLHTVQHIVEMERIGINLPGIMLVLCGLGALALASVGIYGVVAFSVKSRTKEFGVRMALGASRREILRLVVAGGLRQISIGIGAGIIMALGASAMLSSMFLDFGRSAYDGWIYLAVVVLLAGVAVAALAIPARRAASVSPMEALRCE